MNKKINTMLFILGATVFNIAVTVICFVGLFVLYARFIMLRLPETGQSWGFPLCFLLAIVFSFFIYRIALKFLLKKMDMEKYFDPIFRGRRRT